jgi:hypothetical protein
MRKLMPGLTMGTCGLTLWLLSVHVGGQAQPPSVPPAIPSSATTLEGSPTVQVETTSETTNRRALSANEANQRGLSIRVMNGRYFWTSRQDEELTLKPSGEFTYLTTTSPGRYVRLQRINDRLAYVEHVDMDSGSVTYFGELRITLAN